MNITVLNNILERNKLKDNILQFVEKFYNNTNDLSQYRGIYLYGDSGIGKTQFIKKILSDYDVIYYDAGHVRNKSVINNITKHNMSNNNVLSLFQSKRKRIVIVMDEIENMNQGDKGGINLLLKMIRSKKTKKQRQEDISSSPIICIGNYQNDKKMNELKKICLTFVMPSPTKKQLNKLVMTLLPDLSTNTLSKLLDRIVNLNQLSMYIKMYHNNPTYIDTIIDNEMTIFDNVNTDTKLMTQNLLSSNQTISSHSNINETDRTIIALLLHENVIDIFEKHPIQKTMPLYLKVLENICFADYVDRITFQRQIWQFNEMSSLLKNIYSSYLLNDYKTTLKEIRFTKILTKYSTEYNNKLFIQSLTQSIMLDKKDLCCYIYKLLYEMNNNEERILLELENTGITKLDINRIIRYLVYVYPVTIDPL